MSGSSTHPDVVVIDTASRRGNDQSAILISEFVASDGLQM